MKPTTKIIVISMFVANVVLSAAASNQALGANYKAIDLTPCGFDEAVAQGVSGNQQVGWGNTADGSQHALLWNGSADSFIDLHPSGFPYNTTAFGTNGTQQVGYGWPSGGHALLWRGSADNFIDLNPSGFSYSQAVGISGTQQVGYGHSSTTGGYPHALLWSGSAASCVDLNPGGFDLSYAWGTDSVQQVGYGVPAGSFCKHALLWSGSADSFIDLNPNGFTDTGAIGISGNQQVGFGFGPLINNEFHALIWSGSADSFIDLNPSGFFSSSASGTNGIQQAGEGLGPETDYKTHALAWNSSPNTFIDLHQFLPAGFDYSRAEGIDGYGNIVGRAEDSSGKLHAILWKTAPEANMLSLKITGLDRVPGNSRVQYRAIAYYDNNIKEFVTDIAQWSVEPNTVAVIDADGVLITGIIFEPQDITIHAMYTQGGVNIFAELPVLVDLPTTLEVPAEYGTIQSAIDVAWDGDIVLVSPGTYTGEGNRDIDFLGKAITVCSIDPNDPCIVAATIIDCNGTEDEHHRGFYFYNNEDANSVVAGFTIKNGFGLNDSGIYCHNSSPTVTNCMFIENSAIEGGGMYNDYYSNPTVTNCTFIGNSAERGSGGGMLNFYCSNPTVTNCTFTGNSAERGSGGGMFNYDSSPLLINCTFTSNSADSGGGICNCDYSSPRVINCTFNDNSADSGGGVYNDYHSNPVIINCTFCSNLAISYGGGIYSNIFYNNPTLTNCILWGNTAPSGTQIYNEEASSSVITFSDIQDGWPGLGNIDADPCFVNADANDYHLKSEGWRWDAKRSRWTYDDVTSRCIDAGNPGSSLRDELLSVPDDPNNEWGENLRIDMGAFGGTAEASIPPYDWALLADLTNNGIVNLEDYAYQAADWLNSADSQPGDLNRDGLIDIDDLALLTDDWLAQTSWR